jgi:hypothetical protein
VLEVNDNKSCCVENGSPFGAEAIGGGGICKKVYWWVHYKHSQNLKINHNAEKHHLTKPNIQNIHHLYISAII